MYQIDRNANDITQLKECLFSELGFRERENLQEWIAKNPEALQENLLIIQKEFSGFSETNERLDLLALDQEGSLVVIENKLDDTGRDVVWQALKYASYCSTLSTKQTIKIYQEYLDTYNNSEDAKSNIMEFLGIENEDDLLLNKNDQRIIFVANNYRKEVTSTVMWLLNHDIKMQCFRAIPYSLGNELFLQIDQIIPVPEIEEFMIEIKEKQREDRAKGAIATETDKQLIGFWKMFKADVEHHNIHFFDNVTPKPRFYMGFSKGKGSFVCAFGKKVPRIELYFSNDAEKKLFDAMHSYKTELETAFGKKLMWERLDNKKASRIKFEMPQSYHDELVQWGEEGWEPERIEWFRETLINFYAAVYPIWEKVQKELK